jgi:hypothetical protein
VKLIMDAENQDEHDLTLMHTGQMTLSMFQEKDKEIARLSKEGYRTLSLYIAAAETLLEKDKLLTECADALEKANPTDRYRDLIQRAREATK